MAHGTRTVPHRKRPHTRHASRAPGRVRRQVLISEIKKKKKNPKLAHSLNRSLRSTHTQDLLPTAQEPGVFVFSKNYLGAGGWGAVGVGGDSRLGLLALALGCVYQRSKIKAISCGACACATSGNKKIVHMGRPRGPAISHFRFHQTKDGRWSMDGRDALWLSLA